MTNLQKRRILLTYVSSIIYKPNQEWFKHFPWYVFYYQLYLAVRQMTEQIIFLKSIIIRYVCGTYLMNDTIEFHVYAFFKFMRTLLSRICSRDIYFHITWIVSFYKKTIRQDKFSDLQYTRLTLWYVNVCEKNWCLC